MPGYEVEIRDDVRHGRARRQPGAPLRARQSIALGYWYRTEVTRQVFQGEWVRTGDTYVRTDDGYYTCLGRNSDIIKAGGIWVSPAEVEERLLEHPGPEAAVVGVADEDGLDKPVAVVVLDARRRRDRRGADDVVQGRAGALQGAAQGGVRDELPKTATGKLQRFKVREPGGRTARTRPGARA